MAWRDQVPDQRLEKAERLDSQRGSRFKGVDWMIRFSAVRLLLCSLNSSSPEAVMWERRRGQTVIVLPDRGETRRGYRLGA